MRKQITIFVYDNDANGTVRDHLIRSFNGGDCAEMQVLLPNGWDAWENDFGLVLESPNKIRYSVAELITQRHGIPYMFGHALDIVSDKRQSCAITTEDVIK